jgi:hypothetical protein
MHITKYFSKINLPQKDIVDLFAYECSQAQKFTINPVQDCFQKVPFTGIFTVKQLQQLTANNTTDNAKCKKCTSTLLKLITMQHQTMSKTVLLKSGYTTKLAAMQQKTD